VRSYTSTPPNACVENVPTEVFLHRNKIRHDKKTVFVLQFETLVILPVNWRTWWRVAATPGCLCTQSQWQCIYTTSWCPCVNAGRAKRKANTGTLILLPRSWFPAFSRRLIDFISRAFPHAITWETCSEATVTLQSPDHTMRAHRSTTPVAVVEQASRRISYKRRTFNSVTCFLTTGLLSTAEWLWIVNWKTRE
jgi:hypothetical protein